MSKKKPEPPFIGRWRLVSMSEWDQDYLDEDEEAIISSMRKLAVTFTSDTSTVRWTAA